MTFHFWHDIDDVKLQSYPTTILNEKKRSEETQTLRAGCSKAEPKDFATSQTPFPGGGGPAKI